MIPRDKKEPRGGHAHVVWKTTDTAAPSGEGGALKAEDEQSKTEREKIPLINKDFHFLEIKS